MSTTVNTEELASPKTLWALHIASKAANQKKDYRNLNLTKEQASAELQRLNAITGYTGKGETKIVTTTPIKKNVVAKAKTNNVTTSNNVVTNNNVSLEDSFKAYIVANIQKLVDALNAELGIEAVVKNDTNFVPDDGKRFVMYGQGCGFVMIDGFRKTEKNKQIVRATGAVKEQIDAQVRGLMPIEIVLNKPLIPLQAQSLQYNLAYHSLACKWIATQGVKNAYPKGWQD